MTTGDEVHDAGTAAAGGPVGVRKRTADFVQARSRAQKLGALGAVALLISAPFGGLDEVHTPPRPLVEATTYDLGPVEVSITGVSSVPTLAPALEPQAGNRLLVVRMEVHNIADQPLSPATLAAAVSGSGTGAVPFAGDAEPRPVLLNVEDGQRLGVINPGVSYDTALVLEQSGDWEPQPVELHVATFAFQADDPLNADPAQWVLSSEELAGDFDVRVRS